MTEGLVGNIGNAFLFLGYTGMIFPYSVLPPVSKEKIHCKARELEEAERASQEVEAKLTKCRCVSLLVLEGEQGMNASTTMA